MLTWSDLERHRNDGRLVKYLVRKQETKLGGRCLYMIPDVYDAFMERPWPITMWHSPRAMRERRVAMRMVLERFVTGGILNLGNDMKELGSQTVNALMRGFFEFRSGLPVEQTRLFGFFPFAGAFVATSFRARGEMEPAEGEKPHEPWARERAEAQAEWDALFGAEAFLAEPWPVIKQSDLAQYLG